MAADVPIISYEKLRAETYTDVAAATLLVYDYVLTLNSEITLMWPSRLNFVKVLFLLTRYMPFVDVTLVLSYQFTVNITPETCERFYTAAGWFIVVGVMIAEAILVVRTWAIWGRGRRLAIILGLLSTAAALPVIVIENIFLTSVRFSPHPYRGTAGCLLSSGNAILAVNFIIVILWETFMLVLTLIKGIQHHRFAVNRSFVTVLYRDGMLFYLYLLAISVANFVIIIAAPSGLADVLAISQRVLHSCLSTRVLLNLREAQERDTDLPLNSAAFQEFGRFLVTSEGAAVGDNGQSLLPPRIPTIDRYSTFDDVTNIS